MLTVLDVQKHTDMKFHERLKSLICPYRICADVKSKDNLSVLYIQYHLYRGRVNFDKLYALTIGYPKTILCSKNIFLQDTFFKRFESDSLKIKVMQNFVISVLDRVGKKINIGYIDGNADEPEFVKRLLNYNSHLAVVSDMPRFYENVCGKLSNKNTTVSNSVDVLENCDIIISVSPVREGLTNYAIIFTCAEPSENLKRKVFYQYQLPPVFSEIKPDCVSREYFLSALYSLGGVKELESIIPKACGDGVQYYSAEYIAREIKNPSADRLPTDGLDINPLHVSV